MARVSIERDDISLDSPILVEGIPGLGLVGKIAADHLVETLEMPHYASCFCEGLPEVAVYEPDDARVRPPVRIHAAPEEDLLVLQSDVPISPSSAREFATCVTGWFAEHDVFPLFISGIQRYEDDQTRLYGVATGDAASELEAHGLGLPGERGVVTGPTGALLYQAEVQNLNSLGLIVEASPQFPDPGAAKQILDEAILDIADIDIDTEVLLERAQEISEARERLAQQMQQSDDESSRARPLGMFQ